MAKISIIIRTKNEEKWIGSCLDMVLAQEGCSFEVVVVDDHSKDRTRDIVAQRPVKLLQYEGDYLPGRVLNAGIRASTGEIIVCLSGHCVPTSREWLKKLVACLDDAKVAAVYGRQEPLPYSSPRDKRDLWTIFGLDRKVQWKDPFFHNANSALRRSLWEQVSFDEQATNIEDRLWAKEMLSRGHCIVYEPEASVYHWHGIHQDGNDERCRGVVRILESLHAPTPTRVIETDTLRTVAIIPVRGEVPSVGGESLLRYTIERAKESSLVHRVIVATDTERTALLAEQLGAEAPFLRPKELSSDVAGLEQVIAFTLNRLEQTGERYENVLVLQVTNPFRPKGFVDGLLREMLLSPVETVVPARQDFRLLFKKDSDGALRPLSDGLVPRSLKEPFFTGLLGLGVLTKASMLRDGNLFGANIGVHVVMDKRCELEIADQHDADMFAQILEEFWNDGSPHSHSGASRLDQGSKQEPAPARR